MGNEQPCRYKGKEDVQIDDTPPTTPQDTTTAFRALTHSGDHKRRDTQCINDLVPKPNSSFWRRIMSSEKPNQDLTCSGSIKPPQLKNLKGDDIRNEYYDYLARLRQKHEKESRYYLDRYTNNLTKVEKKFAENEKEPVCLDLEQALYTSLRKNRLRPLDSFTDGQNYIRGVRKNASLCFRLAPESKRKQRPCDTEFQIVRETPRDEDDEPERLDVIGNEELPDLELPPPPMDESKTTLDKHFLMPTAETSETAKSAE